MQLSLNGANRSREATRKVPAFSKQWEPGSRLHCFYRTYIDDDTGRRELLAGACWGHKVQDMKAFGVKTTFIPSLCDFDQDGKPIGRPDILWRFSHLAPYFTKGQQLAEEDAINKRNFPNESLRRDALKKVEEKYDKNSLSGIKPVIGRAQMLITVEVVVVPYKDDKPDFDVPVIACQPISGRLATRLDAILRDARYAPADGEEFLEVEWDFPLEDGNKAQSGQAAVPAGVPEQYRMSTQFPELYEKVKARFSDVSTDSDMVRKRATSGVKESVIEQAIRSYAFMNIAGLEGCSYDEDTLTNVMGSADVIDHLDLARSLNNPVFTERLEKELAELKAAEADVEIPPVEEQAPDLASAATATEAPAPTTTEAGEETPAEQPNKPSPTIEGLLAQQAATAPTDPAEDMSQSLDDVDLSSFSTQQ